MKYNSMAIQSNKNFKLVSKEVPELEDNEILVKVKGCYICGSDLKTIKFGNNRVKDNRIMGHEIAGSISKVGSKVKGFEIGENVALGADFPCLNCEMCASNNYDRCLKHLALGHEIDGGFSEYVTLPSSFVKKGPIVKISKDVPLVLAALAEPVACCLRSIKKHYYMKNIPSISIIGGGPIGAILSTILSIKYPSSKLNIFEPNIERRRLLISKDIGHFWYENTKLFENNSGGDLIFVACSILEAQHEALRIINHGGTICLFGGISQKNNYPVLDSNLIHYKELCVYGTTGSDKKDVKEASRLITQNQALFQKIISKKFSLFNIKKAFEEAYKGSKLKIFVECDRLNYD